MNGVVGSTGRKIPSTPSAMNSTPDPAKISRIA